MKKNLNQKKTLYLTKEAIKRGKLMAAVRGKSFSQMVEDLINANYKVKEIVGQATASEVKPDRAVARSRKLG